MLFLKIIEKYLKIFIYSIFEDHDQYYYVPLYIIMYYYILLCIIMYYCIDSEESSKLT
jgi:hypothetical protein